jgi:LysM repeat protein
MLPLGGIIVGVVALLLGGYAAFSIPKMKTQLAAHEDKLSHQDDIASQAAAAAQKADSVNTKLDSVAKQTNDAFVGVGAALGDIKAQIAKLEESSKRPAHGAKGPPSTAVAGPGEYIIRHGDTGRKVARANGCTIEDLSAVNPGVNWAKLRVGQKIKLPEKKAQ